MNTKECYEKIGSNYESVLSRFGNEALVKRFALKFLKDPSYAELRGLWRHVTQSAHSVRPTP